MNKSEKIIEFTQKKKEREERDKERDKEFAIQVYSELIAGVVDPKTVYDILTEQGKYIVSQRMSKYIVENEQLYQGVK
ncbi:MAG: hypothetical protein ACK5LL_06600 [Suipraeoptans sp.]